MKVTVDRIDEGIAVLLSRDDDALQVRIPARLLPPDCREGDILTVTFERDDTATREVKSRVAGLIRDLKKSP
jgi:hypothetical protein